MAGRPHCRLESGGITLKKRILREGTLIFAVLLASGVMFAHHGNSDYDRSQLLTLKGTVVAFEFINPHARILFDVKDDQGKVVQWNIELGSPNSMRRRGWRRDTIKPSDQITIIGNPNKNGSPDLHMQKLLLPDGKEVSGDGQ